MRLLLTTRTVHLLRLFRVSSAFVEFVIGGFDGALPETALFEVLCVSHAQY